MGDKLPPFRISGLVKAQSQVREFFAESRDTANKDARKLARDVIEQVRAICLRENRTPDDLPLPSRKAHAYLLAIAEGENHMLARSRSQLIANRRSRSPAGIPGLKKKIGDLSRIIWKRRNDLLRNRDLLYDLYRHIEMELEDGHAWLQGRDRSHTITGESDAWLAWLSFLLERDHLRGTIKAAQRAERAAAEALGDSKLVPEIHFVPLYEAYAWEETGPPRAWYVSAEFYNAPKRIWKAFANHMVNEDDHHATREVHEFLTSTACKQYVHMLQPKHAPPPDNSQSSSGSEGTLAHQGFLEQQQRAIAELLDNGCTAEELNDLLAQCNGDLSKLTRPATKAAQAQDLAYQALDAQGLQRVHLARKALELDPNCADAHTILGEQVMIADPEAAIPHFKRARDAALSNIDPANFQDNVGHFWGLIETRPYIRALFQLAKAHQSCNDDGAARDILERILELNARDNMGARYSLMGCLLRLKDPNAARQLLKRFPDDPCSLWTWSEALLSFRELGDKRESRELLERAHESNPFVAAALRGDSLPPSQYPEATWSPGDVSETSLIMDALSVAWRNTPGAMTWLNKRV